MKIKDVQDIIKDFERSSLMTMELEMEGFKIKLSKNKAEEKIVSTEKESKLPTNNDLKEPPKTIKSPLVGTFYLAPTPNSKPFVEIGEPVKKGQVVCIIEAMKIMNEIKSPYEGILLDILIENGHAVGYDQTMFVMGDGHEK